MPTIYQIVIVALLSAFIILGATKTGIRDKVRDIFDALYFTYEQKLFKLIASMLDCDYCFSFWMSLFICIIAFALTFDLTWLIVPVLSTPLTRFLL